MKTVLFVSPTGTLDNGAEVSIFNLMKFLKIEGYEVINIAPTQQKTRENEYSRKFIECGIECHLINCQRWWWEEAPGHLFGSAAQRAEGFRATIKYITEVIESKHVDIVISNTVNVFQGAVAAALTNRKHFWLIHEFPENEFSYYINKLDFINDYATEIFSVNGLLKEKIEELFPKRKIKAFAPYTEIETVKPLKSKQKRIVSIGRISERKNQLELIQAFEKLAMPGLELVFIGGWDEAYKAKCDLYLKEKRIKNVSFLGNQDQPWEKLTDQDVCVFPSAMETFGLVYVEALLNGIPVILSDNPGHTSAYEMFKFGHLYQTGNVNELTELMKKTLANFPQEQQAARTFSDQAKDIYELSVVYKEIIAEIDNDELILPHSIRHLTPILTLDEKKSKLARLEFAVRHKLQRIKYKLFRK